MPCIHNRLANLVEDAGSGDMNLRDNSNALALDGSASRRVLVVD